MRIICALLLSLLYFITYSQTITELETSIFRESDWDIRHSLAWQLLKIDKLNSVAYSTLLDDFWADNEPDSSKALFDYLIDNNPENPQVYVEVAKEYHSVLTNHERINYLEQAQKLDSTNLETIYLLGKCYYKLFIDGYRNKRSKEQLHEDIQHSIRYFTEFYKKDTSYGEMLKFPLIQMAYYLEDEEMINRFSQIPEHITYFPLSAFTLFRTDWRTNFSSNVLDWSALNSGAEEAKSHADYYSRLLEEFNEPVLKPNTVGNAFRLIMIGNAVLIIRIEKINDTIKLYRKLIEYPCIDIDSTDIVIDNKKKISDKQWNKLITKIEADNFWLLPSQVGHSKLLSNDSYITNVRVDGTNWILEGKLPNKYHLVYRGSTNSIYEICSYLYKLAKIKVERINPFSTICLEP